MIHPGEIVLTFIGAILVATTLVVMPKPKPEPPAEPQKPAVEVAIEECAKDPETVCVEVTPTVSVEPQTKEQKQIQDVRVQLDSVSERAARIERKLDERAKDERVDR